MRRCKFQECSLQLRLRPSLSSSIVGGKSYARQSGSDMLLSQADFGLGGSRQIQVGRQNKLPLDFAQINLYMSLGEIKLLSY